LELIMKLTEEQKKACRDAAEYISQHGHTKEQFYDLDQPPLDGVTEEGVVGADYTPPACALGALGAVTGEFHGLVSRWSRVPHPPVDLRKGLLDVGGVPIQEWNDDPATTAEDVVLKLKEFGNS
jgi:hypothetical protein